MKQFQFEFIYLDRIEIRDDKSLARGRLDALGAEGWRIVQIRDDAQHERQLLLLLEREQP